MAELTYASAGVGFREVDLSGPSQSSPTGTPAGVIGTSQRGPAYVPLVAANYKEFTNRFGQSDGKMFGPMAMYQWLKNAGSGLYVRVLGVGDAKKRTSSGLNAGKVNNAGYVVGSRQVQKAGDLGVNPFAYTATGIGNGRTYFLGSFMSESNGSTYLSEAGLQTNSAAVPIVRGVLLAPSGVLIVMSSSDSAINNSLPASSAPTTWYGFKTGSVDPVTQGFKLLLSGHVGSTSYPNSIIASFDPTAPNYFGSVFNTDATKIEEAGHFLLTSWDIHPVLAVTTGSGVTVPAVSNPRRNEAGFVLRGYHDDHNSGSVETPNYEGFEDRFSHAESTWVISQKFGGEPENLFKVHALDDGSWANTKVKISIRNISPSSDPTSEYGTFDLFVRDFSDTDDNQIVLEVFTSLSLNPGSPRYFARMIGDTHMYYDFDREAGNQKLVVEGNYPNVSRYIRVEPSQSVENSEVPASSLPMGFRGYWYLNTSGDNLLNGNLPIFDNVKQPPVPFRRSVAAGTGTAKRPVSYFHWGVQQEVNDSLSEPNKNNYHDNNLASFATYFAKYHTDFANPWIGGVDSADSFNNNMFTLENVGVVEGTNGYPDPNEWQSAAYCRNGVVGASLDRFLAVSDLEDLSSRRYLKFTFTLQGGFDGVNVFDKEKSKMSNISAIREMVNPASQGGSSGPTVASFRKAIDVISEKSDVDVQVVAVPGIREPGITDYALDAVENRFDAIYVIDVPELNTAGNVITGSSDIPSVSLTAAAFKSRQLDSSFGAAYYPDVVTVDPGTGIETIAPPSVAVLGAFSLNDSVAYPWFAPAGHTRGALSDVIETQVKLNRDNADSLYVSNINPIMHVPDRTSPIIHGQKTTLNRSSALDRVNVRRLLIELRRRVRNAANQVLFEPNRESTLARFSSLVDPILKQIQAQSGVDRYLVKIDTTTTTQADVENNTIRGKIFIQPTKSIEFVSLDFVVTNAGAVI